MVSRIPASLHMILYKLLSAKLLTPLTEAKKIKDKIKIVRFICVYEKSLTHFQIQIFDRITAKIIHFGCQ